MFRILTAFEIFVETAKVKFTRIFNSSKVSSAPLKRPIQYDAPRGGGAITEAASLIKLNDARARFDVTGKDLTVAVLDSGLAEHDDFSSSRILTKLNYTSSNGRSPSNANDLHGHGTHVTGIIAADGVHTGIAPKSNIIPIKVLRNDTDATIESWKALKKALVWVLENYDLYKISVVNISIADISNNQSDKGFENRKTRKDIKSAIKSLRGLKIPVVVSAGNYYGLYNRRDKRQGMSWPAIIHETISVGAVYDSVLNKQELEDGKHVYPSGASANSTVPDAITPYSQRLHESSASIYRTDIFAPGSVISSSGVRNRDASSDQNGTSQAAPVISGVLLLLQEYYKRKSNSSNLPTVDQLEKWLRLSGQPIFDGDNEDDNVTNTNQTYKRVDVLRSLELIDRDISD